MVELLCPVGDFDCLQAAVQNGADSVYFGGNFFNARFGAKNFDDLDLKKAINYAKLRNVKVDFTLNIWKGCRTCKLCLFIRSGRNYCTRFRAC